MARATPRGVHTLTPHLVLQDCAAAMTFYTQVFGASEGACVRSTDGRRILHAELRVGDSIFYVSDEFPGSPARAPTPEDPAHLALQVYLPDAEAAHARALAAGARELAPTSDGPYGDRSSVIADPFGYVWTVSRHVHHVRLDDERDGWTELEEPSRPPA